MLRVTGDSKLWGPRPRIYDKHQNFWRQDLGPPTRGEDISHSQQSIHQQDWLCINIVTSRRFRALGRDVFFQEKTIAMRGDLLKRPQKGKPEEINTSGQLDFISCIQNWIIVDLNDTRSGGFLELPRIAGLIAQMRRCTLLCWDIWKKRDERGCSYEHVRIS